MSSLSSTQTKPKPKARMQAVADAPTMEQVETTAVAGAKLLAEAVASAAFPNTPKRNIRGLSGKSAKSPKRAVSFLKAYSTIGQAVPEGNRVWVLSEMLKALKQTIEAEQQKGAHAAQPATPLVTQRATGKTQQPDAQIATGMAPQPATQPTMHFATGRAQQENDDFIAEMRSESQTQRIKDIASKKLLKSAAIAGKLGVTPQAVTAAVRANSMFALAGPSGDSFVPAFFADAKYDRKVLGKVSRVLGGMSGGSKWDFFTSPRISLNGKSPLDALAKGNIKQVLEVAAAFRDE